MATIQKKSFWQQYGGLILILGGTAIKALDDYTAQRAAGKNPVFKASTVGLEGKTDYWND